LVVDASPGLLLSSAEGSAHKALVKSGCEGLYLLDAAGHDGRPCWRSKAERHQRWLHFVARNNRWQVSVELGSDACLMYFEVDPPTSPAAVQAASKVFGYRGAGTETFTVPISGRYRLVAVGAKAANGSSKQGGRGGIFFFS